MRKKLEDYTDTSVQYRNMRTISIPQFNIDTSVQYRDSKYFIWK